MLMYISASWCTNVKRNANGNTKDRNKCQCLFSNENAHFNANANYNINVHSNGNAHSNANAY